MPVLALVDPAVLLPFLAAAVLMEVTPGPNMGWLALTALAQGRRAGLAAVAGVTLGLAAWMLAATLGLAELLTRAPVLYAAVAWGGVAFMLYLAWDAWRGPGVGLDDGAAPQVGRLALFRRGLIGNLLNPKAAALYAVALPAFAGAGAGAGEGEVTAGQTLTLGLLHLAVSVVVHGGIVLAAAGLGGRLLRLAERPWARAAMAGGLALIALWLGWETAR
jgi:threonine/homoserine/homoserine lactone efflux protein